jgi:signal transduction histidine kinase
MVVRSPVPVRPALFEFRPADERQYFGRSLTVARLFVAAFALLSFIVESPRHGAGVVYPVAAAYFLFAVAALAARKSKFTRLTGGRAAVALHCVDLACAVVMFMGDGATAGLLGSMFVVVAAAWRWGLRPALATAAAFLLVPMIGAALPGALAQPGALLVRGSFVLGMGGLIACFVQSEQRRRADAAIILGITSRANLRVGLKTTLSTVLGAVLRRFASRLAVLVVHEQASGSAFLWQSVRNGDSGERIRVTPLERDAFATYSFAADAAAWHAIHPGNRDAPFDVVAIDRDGRSTAASGALPAAFVTALGPFRQIISIDVSVPDEWSGRLFLIDPLRVGRRHDALLSAFRLVHHLVPVVHSVYMLRWLRSRSAADERARIARELHDGVVQALMGVHIQLHALSVQSAPPSSTATELSRLSGLLRDQVAALRDTMQQLKPLDLGPDRLIDTLAEIVHRFQRETGIVARFITPFDRMDLPPRACREVTRVVQEALVNVRKHSGARNVYVRLTVVNGQWQLSIDDDGCGFPFAGRMSQPELLQHRQGPAVIGERIRLLGGELTLQSEPGRGARLEISLPLVGHGIES